MTQYNNENIQIKNSKVLILATNGFQKDELFSPRKALMDKSVDVYLASPSLDEISSDWNDNQSIKPDTLIENVTVGDFDALILPGGLANPDTLRQNIHATNLVRKFADNGKIIAAICHAPWILIDAGLVRGREMTSYPSIKTDLINAGASWVDQEVAISNGIITSRSPDDLEAFNAKIIEEIHEGEHTRNLKKQAA